MTAGRQLCLILCISMGMQAAMGLRQAAAQAQPDRTQPDRTQTGMAQTDAITVYATRSPQAMFEVPSLVSRLEADAPGQALAHNLADFLAFLPGVNLDGGPRRNGQTLAVRGFDDEAILTLLDGRRQNFESEHDGRMFLDPALLKSVEIVRGASSAIYGGGAIGGVAAYETKSAAELLPPGQIAGARVSGGYRSANQEGATSLAAFARARNWDIMGAFAFRDSGQIAQGGGGRLEADARLVSGLVKASVSLADYHTFKWEGQLFRQSGTEPNNPQTLANQRDNLRVDKDVRDAQLSVKYAYDQPQNPWLKPRAHVYYNDTRVDETDLEGGTLGREQARVLQTIGVTLDNASRLRLGARHRHLFSYGFELYRDRQDGRSSAAGERSGVPDAEALNYGFYLQDEVMLDTPAGRLLFIPAVRVDSYTKEDSQSRSQNRTQVSPKISLSYVPIEQLMVFGSWAQAFRAPNLTETFAIGRHFAGGAPDVAFGVRCPNLRAITVPAPPGRRPLQIRFVPNNNFVPNPGLKPETVSTMEFGAGLRGGTRAKLPGRAEVKGSWFRSDGRNFIAREIDVCAGTTQFVNIASARLSGWEVELRYAWQWLQLRLAGFAVEAENADSGAPISSNVPLTLVADAAFEIARLDSVLGWRGRFADDNDRVGAGDFPTAGYAVNDIYWRFVPRVFGPRKPVRIDFSIENVLDESYQKRFSAIREEGRSFNFRLALQW